MPLTRTQKKKAVEIAKDVLKQIKKVKVTQGVYFNANLETAGIEEIKEGTELQILLPKLLNERKKPCEVCALGACFISYVGLHDNNFKAPTMNKENVSYDSELSICDDEFRDKLKGIFGERNLYLIENAFECDNQFGGYGVVEADEIEIAKEFGEQYDNDTERLRAIMKNLIENKGEFLPYVTRSVAKEK